jgi:cystathionine beta-lyase
VVVGFNLASHAFVKKDGSILVQPPVYEPIYTSAMATGRRRIEARLVQGHDGMYGIDWDSFKTATARKPGMFILCNPQNPTGRVFRRDELEKMAEMCLSKGITICSDEIHCDLVYGCRHIPVASLGPDVAKKTITLIAPSKTFNIAGLQCSIAIIQNAELRRKYLAARAGVVAWVNLTGLIAGEAAYRGGQDWLDQLMVYLEANRDFVMDFVSSKMPGFSIARPEGTYLAWIDCRNGRIGRDPYKFFLGKARVALSDGKIFGTGGEGFVRLNFGSPRKMLVEALERMARALKRHVKGGK